MKTMEGLATSSTAMVSRLRCSTLRPLRPVQQNIRHQHAGLSLTLHLLV